MIDKPTDEPFLSEPIQPKPENYQNPENYQFALDEYKQKLTTYTARKEWVETNKQIEQEEKKHVFHYLKQIHYPSFKDFCPENDNGEPTPFKPATIAQWIAQHEKLHFKTDVNTGMMYFYNGKNWASNGETYLEYITQEVLGPENRESHYRNILHALKALTYTELEFSRKIACENGLLDVETQTLTDFNEKEMPFHEIKVKYDPEAKCPNWLNFITQVVNQDDLATIQEWSGFLLLPDYRFHKLLWIHGQGRNGKGVWQRTIEAILGEKNISGIGLEEFDGNHRFALKQLYGKLFNPCSEPTANKELPTNLLKKATGQDTIEAEIKGKQKRLSFRNYSKITVLANKFPKVRDQTTAFKERRLFIKFPNEFVGEKQIQNIEDKWLKTNDEKSGILNWMLEGLKRLIEQGHFTESKTQQETEAEFLRASDTIGAFQHDMFIWNKTKVTSRSITLEAYKNYCEILGLDVENEKKFTQRMKDTPKISPCLMHKPKVERAWRGIALKNITDEGEILEPDTGDTLDTAFTPPQYLEKNHLEYREDIQRVSAVSPVSKPQEKKPVWFVKTIPQGAKCECGEFCVTRELVQPNHEVILRCESCFEKLKKTFGGAEWRLAEPDLCMREDDGV